MRGIALKYGLMMFGCFTLYFLVMQALELSDNYYFRVFNILIHVVVIGFAISAYKKHYPKDFNYMSGVSVGVLTSLTGVIPFAIFILVFLFKSPDLMEALTVKADSLAPYMNPFTAALVVLVEGLAVSLIGSYTIMRLVDSYR